MHILKAKPSWPYLQMTSNILPIIFNGSLIFTAGEDALLNAYFASQVIDLDVEPVISARPHGIHPVTCLATYGKYIVTGGLDGRVILHSYTPLKEEAVIFEGLSYVHKVSISEEWICASTKKEMGEKMEVHLYNRMNQSRIKFGKAYSINDLVLFSNRLVH